MLLKTISHRHLVCLALFLAISAKAPASAETYLGSNVDSRVVIAFKVDDKAAQGWLPADWDLTPFPGGPIAGANLLAVLVNSHLVLDPEGNPATPASYRGVALASLAGHEGSDEKRLFVTRVYVTDLAINPYKNSVAASVGRSASYKGEPDAPPARTEEWTIGVESGGEMTISMDYRADSPTWSTSKSFVYSAVEPDFHRIYRYDQLADLVMSVPLEKKAAGEITFNTSIPELTPMFDGSEEMVAVIAVPVYVRKLYLP